MTTMKEILGEAYKQKNVDTLVKQLSQLTDDNDHTGARLLLAKQLNASKWIEALQGVEMIQRAEMGLPSEILKYRENIYKDLMKLAKRKYSKEEYNKIYGAF